MTLTLLIRSATQVPDNGWIPKPDACKYGAELTDDQISDIIAFIQSLK